MQKFLDFISSKSFRNVMCFILFTFLMSVTISSQNYFFQKVIENGISKKDIVAQKDIKVIDTKKTEQHKKEVAQNVEPILTQAEDEFIATSLVTLQNSVKKIREKNVSDEVKKEELNVLFDEAGKRGLVEFLLKANDNDLQMVFDKAKITLSSVLNVGISSKDFENNNVSGMNLNYLSPRHGSVVNITTEQYNKLIAKYGKVTYDTTNVPTGKDVNDYLVARYFTNSDANNDSTGNGYNLTSNNVEMTTDYFGRIAAHFIGTAKDDLSDPKATKQGDSYKKTNSYARVSTANMLKNLDINSGVTFSWYGYANNANTGRWMDWSSAEPGTLSWDNVQGKGSQETDAYAYVASNIQPLTKTVKPVLNHIAAQPIKTTGIYTHLQSPKTI